MQEMWVWSLGWEDPLKKEMATYSSILAWKIPWTEEPGRLQSMGSQKNNFTAKQQQLQQQNDQSLTLLRAWFHESFFGASLTLVLFMSIWFCVYKNLVHYCGHIHAHTHIFLACVYTYIYAFDPLKLIFVCLGKVKIQCCISASEYKVCPIPFLEKTVSRNHFPHWMVLALIKNIWPGILY